VEADRVFTGETVRLSKDDPAGTPRDARLRAEQAPPAILSSFAAIDRLGRFVAK